MTSNEPHGQEGHLNSHVLDQDSPVTDYGQHYRVVAFLPDADGMYCRVDHKHGHRFPTVAQVLRVAKRSQGVGGHWTLASYEEWSDRSATDMRFTRSV